MKFSLTPPADFAFESAVCSYGFCRLAPNTWDPATRTFATTLRGECKEWHILLQSGRRRDRTVVLVQVPDCKALPSDERAAIIARVRRMLRFDEDLTPFHKLCANDDGFSGAAKIRFGRILRSATLFEDMVKTLCTCNITWRQTVAMVERLVEQYGEPAANAEVHRAFPTPARLAAASTDALKRNCGLGYRAEWVTTLARQVESEQLILDELDWEDMPEDELYLQLRAIRGVGEYAASSLAVLLGRYGRLPIDTEIVRHFRTRFPRRKATESNIRRYYARYAPYSFLAYWWELVSPHLDERLGFDPWVEVIGGAGTDSTDTPRA